MKIYEFINNDSDEKIMQLLNSFLFFNEKWMFVDNKDFFKNEVETYQIDIIINTGLKLAENLNRMNIDVLEYDEKEILTYLSKF